MNGLRISELAERTGFSASALRYYEQAGLLPAAARTSGGYRSYGPEAVDRLRFIARAKQLGLPLEEIRELAAVWDGGSCAAVQRRLADRLGGKLDSVRARIAELTAFGAQLSAARDELGTHTPEGACDDGCGCLAGTGAAPGPQPVELLPIGAGPRGETPIACSLTGPEQRDRAGEWAALLARAVDRRPVAGGLRLTFPAGAELAGQLAALAAAEQACCPFFGFALELTAGATVLHVRAPAGAPIDQLFGTVHSGGTDVS